MKLPGIHFKNLSVLVQVAVFGLLFSACTPRSSSLDSSGSASLMAPPKEGTSVIQSQMIRYRGQTQFLTARAGYSTRGGRLESAAYSASPAAAGAPRAEQESDVFKIGKPGSKLLYLLNNYRGLQVVSYEQGPGSPQLLGRAQPTGNYPSDMYLDPNHDRIFVLERVWFDSQNSTYTQNQSRILVYNVSKSEDPTLQESIEIKGEIADSRMVGSVLYVVTTLRPDYNSYRYNASQSQSQGFVTSYDLSGSRINKIQELTLSLPAVYGNNLRVVTVPENNTYKYYLLAHLSEHGWGWWDRQSMVQVVDISDDKGQISPIMTVSVKGTIQRPHQMQIKNNTLIAVSNYMINNQQNNPRIARIAVETFKFPTAQSEILTESEAELRRLYIEKQVTAETAQGVVPQISRQKWVKDPAWGIEGRFVTVKDQVRKIMPDSVVTTGDTTGLSASLQDVRVHGDWLYAFWVPANQVDPLDLFDISAPEKGVRHIQRLTFDGWISRAEPISYNGKNYVVGLGWIVPAVNNENNKRYAQVKLFEIQSSGKTVKAVDVASLVLDKSQFWANFNGQDKFIEFKRLSEGKGEILFEGTRYGNNENGLYNYQDGGQLINFDLSQPDTDKILTEGSFLSGNSSWIKRVFTNSEINRINSFSDASLVTYGPSSTVPSTTVEAVNILELARDIRSYVTLGDKGVQVIGEGNSWSGNSPAKTVLRVVSKTNVDAEKNQVHSEIIIPGGYVSHLKSTDEHSVFILTGAVVSESRKYTQTYQLHQVSLENNKSLKLISSEAWEPKSSTQSTSPRLAAASGLLPMNYGSSSTFFVLPTGEIFALVANELKLIETQSGLSVKSVNLEKCDLTKEDQTEIKMLNEKMYLIKKTSVDIRKELDTYTQAYSHHLVNLDWQHQQLTCGESINVPGNVLAYDGQVMITADSWVQDIYKANDQDALRVSNGLASLKVLRDEKGTRASLVDMIDVASSSDLSYVAFPKSSAQNLTVMKYSGGSPTTRESGALQTVAADKDAYLTQAVYTMPSTISYASLAKVFNDTQNPGRFYAVVKSWRQFQVIELQADGSARPRLVSLTPVNWKNAKENPVTTVNVLEGYSSSSETIHFSAEQRSIEISSGMFGLKQFFLE